MEIAFIGGFALGAVFLFLPGALMVRALGFAGPLSLVWGPPVTLALYAVTAIVFGAVGIESGWANHFIPWALLGALALLGRWLHEGRKASVAATASPKPSRLSPEDRREWALLALYVLVGLGAVALIFLGNIGGLDSYVQEYDNVHHLSLVGLFTETGRWSSLGPSLYMDDPALEAPLPAWGFYPCAWHVLGAMVGSAVPLPPAAIVTLLNALFSSLVLSTGAYGLFLKLFPDDRHTRLFGAFAAFFFASFPWKLLTWGPIYPNLASLCLAPGVMAMFLSCFDGGVSPRRRLVAIALLILGLAALALTQTNVVFTLVVFFYPYCIHRIWKMPLWRRWKGSRWAAVATFTLVAALIWFAIYRSPFMDGIVTFNWPSFESPLKGAADVLLLRLREVGPQPFVALLVAVGLVGLLRKPGKRWLAVSYLLMAVLYVLAVSTDGRLKQQLTGFWYTDPFRLGANIALFGIPLAAYGLTLGYDLVVSLIAKVRRGDSVPAQAAGSLPTALSALAVAALVFWQGLPLPGQDGGQTAFGQMRQTYRWAYDQAGQVYDEEEAAFVAKVRELVGEDELILNNPNDGSCFAYAADGLNVYYRPPSGYEAREAPRDGRVIRFNLDALANDGEVRQAVRNLDARYVLQLDAGDFGEASRRFVSYVPWDFLGIDMIGPDTAGFELVLEEGDCRLYRITGAA